MTTLTTRTPFRPFGLDPDGSFFCEMLVGYCIRVFERHFTLEEALAWYEEKRTAYERDEPATLGYHRESTLEWENT